VWTGALAYAGVVLQANIGRLGDSISLVTNIVFGLVGVMLVRRYVRCWRQRRGNDPGATAPA
jgi:hypothetical protein